MKRLLLALPVGLLLTACGEPPTAVSPTADRGPGAFAPTQALPAPTEKADIPEGLQLAPTQTVVYDFNDLPYTCSWGSTLPNPYKDLSFLTTPYLAACSGGVVVPSAGPFGNRGYMHEVLTQLPHPATSASIMLNGYFQTGESVYLKGYDASGAVVASASGWSFSYWSTISISGATFVRLGITGPTGAVYLDNLTLGYVPPDATPPVITPTVSGTLGLAGWYTSDVQVSWTVNDPESAIQATSGCGPVTVSSDTPGETFTCTAASAGGSSSVSVTVTRDATDPTVTYGAHPATYDVAEQVSFTCTASDNLSGIASTTCAPVTGPAWSFGLGTHGFAAQAVDVAGNEGLGETSFTVVSSFSGVCSLVQSWVSDKGVANSLCAKLDNAAKQALAGKLNARDGLLTAVLNEIRAQAGKKIPTDKVELLIALVTALFG